MKLSQLLEGVAQTSLPDIDITDITSDTRKELSPGFAFVCIKGNTFDGHDSAEEMIKRGAKVIIAERDLGLENQVIVENTRAAYPVLCLNFFGSPQKKIKLIGVTGTNGKTTITTVTKRIFDKLGIKAGLIGTVSNEINDRVIHTERTTPEPYDLAELFKVFGDSTRIRILVHLFETESVSVGELADALKMTVSAISHQLKILKQWKLVRSRRSGKQIYYSLADEHVRVIMETGMEHIEE